MYKNTLIYKSYMQDNQIEKLYIKLQRKNRKLLTDLKKMIEL